MENNELKSFIGSVINENLVQAKTIIFDELNKKLGASLEDKFDQYASSIYESKGQKPDFLDLDGDGDTKESMKKAAKEAEEGESDEAESEDESEEEEESESEDETDEESDEDSEEDEEDSEEEQD